MTRFIIVALLALAPVSAFAATCQFTNAAATIVTCSRGDGSTVSGLAANPDVAAAVAAAGSVGPYVAPSAAAYQPTTVDLINAINTLAAGKPLSAIGTAPVPPPAQVITVGP